MTIIKLLCSIIATALLAVTVTAGVLVSAERDAEEGRTESLIEVGTGASDEVVAKDVVTVVDSVGGSAQAALGWAENFYLQRPLCGASEVRDVEIHDDSILVRLDIDPKWEVSLNKLDEKAAGQWFAIHCPLPVATAEHALQQRDINIVSANAGNPHTNFSCRAFERRLKIEAAARKGGFRAKVNNLLQRLGVSAP